MKIALVGNPNSGKTTVFNELTGSSQHVGNWPGVTVEKKEGRVKYFENISVVDLPGIYSLSPHTLEEVIARNYLTNDSPDVILNILDASNLERNLYLTTQLLELDVPVVVFLNMMDIVNSNGCEINSKLLSKKLGCSIIEGCASKGNGLKEAIQQTKIISEKHSKVHNKVFAKTVEKAVEDITTCFSTEIKRWQAIKLLERDGELIKKLQLSADILGKIETIIFQLERKMDNDSESIIIEERYH